MSEFVIDLKSGYLHINDINSNVLVPQSDSWQHIAVTIANMSDITRSRVTVYLNGTPNRDQTITIMNDFTNAYIGGSSASDASVYYENEYRGLMQDVGLYRQVLSGNEIQSLADGAASLSGATFLPQCLCFSRINSNVNLDNQELCQDNSVR